MVGHLGADASASIGLVASSTWVLGGLTNALGTGFAIKTAHSAGSGDREQVNHIFLQGIVFSLFFSLMFSFVAAGISWWLPSWLGGKGSIRLDSFRYFLVFAISTPLFSTFYYLCAVLQALGNVKVPSIMNIVMCVLDVGLNFVFISVCRLGVLGAALGSCCAALISLLSIGIYIRSKEFGAGGLFFDGVEKTGHKNKRKCLDFGLFRSAFKLAYPIALESCAFSGALVVVTRIIAPLGSVAIAANSFATTAESLCYMPGYGIQEASVTLVGQSHGAGRKDLEKSFSWITVFSGMIVMTLIGIVMYFICPFIFDLLTNDDSVRQLSVTLLRIELFAEPLFGASIVAIGALRGMGDTFVPGIMNLACIWIVRLGLSVILIKPLGLVGIWIAMAAELSLRGIVFLVRLALKGKGK